MSDAEIRFSLPFSGTWLTFWGGDAAEQNHHHDTPSQEYAFDFIMVDDDGSFFRTDGRDNEDYLSFSMDILAPANGEVVEVVNGLRDNRPKELNSFNFIGNYMMIKHDEATYSVLGHLKKNSISVKVGDKVKAGEKIAQCGNSGYSTDPHLHFHVQDSDIFAKVDENYEKIDVARGKKVFFTNLVVDNQQRTDYSPIKGDKVSST